MAIVIRDGFYKVEQSGGSFVTATFFNPDTTESYSEVVRDYEYYDGSRDNDELYEMDIDREAEIAYKHYLGEFVVGDKVRVVTGRKVPVGTVATVVKRYAVKDRYNRIVGYYLNFDNGMRTNEKNCVLYGED